MYTVPLQHRVGIVYCSLHHIYGTHIRVHTHLVGPSLCLSLSHTLWSLKQTTFHSFKFISISHSLFLAQRYEIMTKASRLALAHPLPASNRTSLQSFQIWQKITPMSKRLKVWAIFGMFFGFGQTILPTMTSYYATGQIFIVVIGHRLKNYLAVWSHCRYVHVTNIRTIENHSQSHSYQTYLMSSPTPSKRLLHLCTLSLSLSLSLSLNI